MIFSIQIISAAIIMYLSVGLLLASSFYYMKENKRDMLDVIVLPTIVVGWLPLSVGTLVVVLSMGIFD